jgi:hypothetical protein
MATLVGGLRTSLRAKILPLVGSGALLVLLISLLFAVQPRQYLQAGSCATQSIAAITEQNSAAASTVAASIQGIEGQVQAIATEAEELAQTAAELRALVSRDEPASLPTVVRAERPVRARVS